MQEGSSTVLMLKKGRTYAHAIVMGPPVNVRLFAKQAFDQPDKHGLRPMLLKGFPYPVERAISMMLKAGKTLGITRRAEILMGLHTQGETSGQNQRQD